MFWGQHYTCNNESVHVFCSDIENTDNYEIRFRVDNFNKVYKIIIIEKLYKKIKNCEKLNRIDKINIILQSRQSYFYIQEWYKFRNKKL